MEKISPLRKVFLHFLDFLIKNMTKRELFLVQKSGKHQTQKILGQNLPLIKSYDEKIKFKEQ